MKRYDLIVVGAGPAGLSAAIEAANAGMSVAVFDENDRPGGQLFKQIHKFFGSKEHYAKTRGFNIGNQLLEQAETLDVDVFLSAVVIGIYYPLKVLVNFGDRVTSFAAGSVIFATGAAENMIPFPGWTLPGVMGAGAAQTMMNLHGVRPGNRVLMVGSGNVGLVVSFQLLQAGCKVAAVIDAAPRIGGYGVHASKLTRTGVPFHLSHTVLKAEGDDRVERVTIAQVDETWQPIPGSEKVLEVDTVCMAVGLSPMSQLCQMAECTMVDHGGGAWAPECDPYGRTSVDGIYAAGDVAGIEEASSAMIGGRIAALDAARRGGFIDEATFEEHYQTQRRSLDRLHKGLFAPQNKGRSDITETDDGYPLSQTLFSKGYIDEEEMHRYPGAQKPKKVGVRPVIECIQDIPCNPCQSSCRFGCIQVGDDITNLPIVNEDADCRNCGMCVAVCSGQAIFLVDEDYEPGYATVTVPYEFLPLPKAGDKGRATDRSGADICEAQVVDVKSIKAFDHTALLTMKVKAEMSMKARFFLSV